MYGFWILVGTFIGYYGLFDFGLSSAINRHIAGAIGAGDEDEANRVFCTSLLMYSALGAIILLLTFLTTMITPMFLDNPDDIKLFPKVFIILGVNLAIDLPMRVFLGILYSTFQFDRVSYIGMLNLILRTILVVMVLKLGYQVVALACVTFLASIPRNILFYYFARHALPFLKFSPRFLNRETAKTLLSYSFFIMVIKISEKLRSQTDSFVITAGIGLSAVTHFRIATIFIDYYNQIIGAVFGVLTPFFSQQESADTQDAMKKTLFFSTKLSVCICGFICFGLIAWGRSFIQLWVGPEYLDSYKCIVVLSLCTLISLWQAPSIAYLYGTSNHKYLSSFALIEGVSNLILSLLLVRGYGLLGVAIGTFIPMIINKLVVLPIYFCRVSSILYSMYFYRMIKMFAVACLSLILPSLLAVYFVAASYLDLFIMGFISLVIYSLIIWFFQFSNSEKQILVQIFHSKCFSKKNN